MRTLVLLAIMGPIAAAETSKPMPTATPVTVRINTAELTAFTAVEGRMKALREEFEALEKQRAAIKSDACQRAFQVSACDLKPDGTMTKPKPPKTEADEK